MLGYFDLRKGTQFIYEGQPYEVLEFNQMKKAQREGIAQVRIKNLISGKVIETSFHSHDNFAEADLQRLKAKYLYTHRESFFFCEEQDAAKRFDLSADQIGSGAKFLKAGMVIDALIFEGKIISVSLPIKVQLKVTEAPPGIKGERAEGGVKTVILETVAAINVPLFIEEGEVIEVNTETGEYTRRANE